MTFTPQDAWDELVHKDDRTSPEEYPDHCLISFDELQNFMSRSRDILAGNGVPSLQWPKEIRSLVNEIAGVWDAFEHGIRQEISNTNYAVVREKLATVESLLAAPRTGDAAQTARDTCVDCGHRDPCDDDCPNFIDPSPPAALPAGEAEGIQWRRVNDEPFEYAIQKGFFGDEFVHLVSGGCLRRSLPIPSTSRATPSLCSCKASARDGQHMAWCPALSSTDGK